MSNKIKIFLISVLVILSNLYIIGDNSEALGITIPKLDLLYLDGSDMKPRGSYNLELGNGLIGSSGFIQKQISTPANPTSGYNKLYFKSDNKLYQLTSAGVESEIGTGGAGDVTDVGDCATGACLDGTSDGGTYIKFYDAQGAGQLITGNLTEARTWTLPDATGTVALTTSTVSAASALAADPSDCSANQFANAIAASGNLSCSALADADIPNNITIDSATGATNATNIGITDDTATNATMYPLWVTANTGNLPAKVSSTKLSFNPSSGLLTATGFSGPLTGAVTGNASSASALAANGANCDAGSAPLGVDASGAVEGCFAVVTGTPWTGMGYLTAESDPQVGTLTNTKWCTTDGSAVNCATDAPILVEVDGSTTNELPTAGFAIDVSTTQVDFDPTEITGGTTWDDSGEASVVWGWALSGVTDPQITFGNDLMTLANGLTLTTGNNFIIGTTQWNSADKIDGTKIKDADYGDVVIDINGDWQVSEATALAADPSDCGVGEFANAIAANGNLTCAAPAVGGDVTDVGNCSGGNCLDGTSDGGTNIVFYDAQGATTLSVGDNTGVVALTLPNATGTIALTTSTVSAASALAADPANCASGGLAGGITAAGVAEGCITPNAGTNIANDLEEEVTEGSLADSTIISADIKDGTIAIADLGSIDFGAFTCNGVTCALDAHASTHAVGAADTVFPADPNADRYLMWDDDPGALVWQTVAGGGDVTDVGDCATGACFNGTSGTSLTFNNAGGDGILSYDGTDFNIDKSFSLGTAGVRLAGDGDGAITFTGLGNGFDENFVINLDDTSNKIVFSSGTSADEVQFSGLDILVGGGNINTGNIALTIGDATTDSITFTTDGTGNAEFTFPADVIGDADIDWGTGAGQVSGADITFAEGDITDSTIVSADIKNGTITLADTAITAGRSLTISTDDIAADAELYTDTKCVYIEDPVAADDLKSLWFAKQASTITSLWCESDQTVTAMLQVDDGTPADVDSVDLTCDTTPPEDTSLNGDATLASGDRLDLDVASVSGTPTWVSICWTFEYSD